MCLRPRETLRRIGHFRSYTDHRTQKDDSSKPVTLAAIHVSQVPQSGWPRPLPMGITHSTVSPHRSVDATGRALPMTVGEIHAQAVEIGRGLDALDDMGDEDEQRQTLNALMKAIDEEPLSPRRRFRQRDSCCFSPQSKIENPKSCVGPSAIRTGSRTRSSDWGSNARFGPVEDRRNNRRLAPFTCTPCVLQIWWPSPLSIARNRHPGLTRRPQALIRTADWRKT